MINRIKITLVSLLVLSGGLVMAADQDGYIGYAEDNAPAIRIFNSGSELVTVFINTGGASATNAIVIGSTSNTIDGSGDDDTVAEFAALIAACTNSAGKKVLIVDTDCAVSTTESTDGELLDELPAVNQIKPGSWGRVAWDTSDVKHFRSYLPTSSKGASRGKTTVDSVTGNAGGTGNVAVKGYLNGTKVFDKLYESPYYSTVDGTIYNTNTIVAGVIELDLGIPVGPSDRFVIEAARDTTGTTGAIGLRLTYK